MGDRLTESDGAATDVYTYIANGTGGRTPLLDFVQQGAGGTRDYDYTTQAGYLSQINRVGNVVTLTSDDLGRLTQVQRPSAPSTELVSFSYDGRDLLARAGVGQTLCTLDIDGTGPGDDAEQALTDGVLITRWLFGFTEASLITGAVGPGCTRCTSDQIVGYLTSCDALQPGSSAAAETGMIDADGTNTNEALTDGLLALRYLFGFTGESLITGAVGMNCTRCTADAITHFLENHDDGAAPGTAGDVATNPPETLSGRIVDLLAVDSTAHGSLSIRGIASGPGDSFKGTSSAHLTLVLDDPNAPSRARSLIVGAWEFTIADVPGREVTLHWAGQGLERSVLYDVTAGAIVHTDSAPSYTFTTQAGLRHFMWALLVEDPAPAAARARQLTGRSRLVGRAVATQTATPIYDSEGVLHQENSDLVLYFAGRPVAVGKPGALTYLTTDHLGTPILATAQSAAKNKLGRATTLKVWPPGNRSFEPFGRDVSMSATDNGVFLRLPGQWVDKAWQEATLGADLYYNVHRWYENQTGRYVSSDSIFDPFGFMGDPHPYLYVDSNPLRFKDPLGLYGTNDCSYYSLRCTESGGHYYCDTAPIWCERFPTYPDPNPDRNDDWEGWPRCTRKCLQDCDAKNFQRRKECGPSPYPYSQQDPDPATASFSDHHACHANCYTTCYLEKWANDPVLGRPLGF